jgi:hypothetical protein
MARFSVFSRRICPSVGPLLHGSTTTLRDLEVALRLRREATHGMDVAVVCIARPAVRLPEIAAAEDPAEPHRQAAHDAERRHTRLRGVEREGLVHRQPGTRPHAERRRDLRRDRAPHRAPPRYDEARGVGVAALVTERLDLRVEAPRGMVLEDGRRARGRPRPVAIGQRGEPHPLAGAAQAEAEFAPDVGR